MPTTIRHQGIETKDLANPHAFRMWIKNHLGHRYVRKNIPAEHLLIYLDYVKQTIQKDNQIDLPFWMDIIRKLDSEITSIKKVEE